MQTEIEIRLVSMSDADSIAANIKVRNTPEEIRGQISLFAENGWTHFVAVEDSQVVANIAILPSRYFPTGQPHRAELVDIVIAPSHQGTGLLKRLIETAIAHARMSGIMQLETSAWESNPRAVRAYAKVGFLEWGRLPNAVKRDGEYDDLVFFSMEVPSASNPCEASPERSKLCSLQR